MAANQEINLDTIQPLNPSPTNDSLVGDDSIGVADNVVTVQTANFNSVSTTQSQPDVPVPSSAGGEGTWVGWLGVGIAICAGVLVWRIKDNFSRKANDSEQKISDLTNAMKRMTEKVDSLTNENARLTNKIEELSDRLIKLSRNNNTTSYSSASQSNSMQTAASQKSFTSEMPPKSLLQVKYATLQSPDENGILRFSERTMTDVSSSQKMFMLEIDQQSGTGTYRLNPQALSFILSDLQMFRDFVKPFTFSGNSSKAVLKDKVPGKIIKKGNFWVVEEPLEISITN